MHFGFREDPLLFQQTVREFLAREWPPERVRALWESETGRSPDLWKQLAELGVLAVRVPHSHEGLGLDELDLVLPLEELGRAAVAEPVIATAAVAVPLLVELDSEALCARWLKRAALGEAILVVGHEVDPFVGDAHVADLLLLSRGDEIHAVEPRSATLTPQPSNDPSQRLFTVDWNPTRGTLVAEGGRGRALLGAAFDRGALGCAAQGLGVADRLLELAVAHARQRQQFGRPIGSFQAVKHMLANVKVRVEYARPVVHRAADSVARGVATRAADVSHAKLAACEAAGFAARVALQVHGAIGYTWEQDLHLWMRRAWSLDLAWGTPAFHRERVAARVLADGARLGPGETFRGGV